MNARPYTPAHARERARIGAFRARTLGAFYGQRLTMGAMGAASGYAAQLAAVGLTPDNPDGMYQNLLTFISAPAAYKNADPTWRGAKDNLSWYQVGSVAHLIWPFHWGAWVGNAPTTEPQIRAVFRIPASMGTKQALSQIYGFPFVSSLQYQMQVDDYKKQDQAQGLDVGKALSDAGNAALGVLNALHIPLVNVTAAVLTGHDPIAGLKADMNSFMQAGAIAKGVVSGDLNPLAQAGAKAAAQFGVQLSASDLAAVAKAAQTGDASAVAAAAMGPAYRVAWQQATNYGTQFDASLPPPAGQSYAPGVAKATAPAPAPARKVIPLVLHSSTPTTAAKAAAPAKAAAKPMTTGAKVAVGAAAAGGGTLVWWLATHGWKWVTPRWARALVR